MSQYKVQIQDGEGNNLMPKTMAKFIATADGSNVETKVSTLTSVDISAHVADTDVHVTPTEKTTWDGMVSTAKTYTDNKITEVKNGAPADLDTLQELASAITKNDSTVSTLNAAIGNKLNETDLAAHTDNTDIHVASTDKTNWNGISDSNDATTTEVNNAKTALGTWLPAVTVTAGNTTATITSDLIKTTSILDIYYSVTDGVITTETQSAGSVGIVFDAALTADCTINVKVVNLV